MDDYPLLNIFWTMMWAFFWVMWLFLLFRVIGDLFGSSDLSGWAKAAWTVLVIVLPYVGVLIYLIARGDSMGKRQLERASAQEQKFQEYIRQTAAAPAPDTAQQLEKFADLRTRGDISEDEFARAKERILA